MEALGLDIKLLVAQIVNFGILYIVLKKVLYKPLMKMIDDRNKKVHESLENSQKIEERLQKMEEKEASVLAKAKIKANKEKEELMYLANKQKEEVLEEAKLSAKRELEKGIESIESAKKEAVEKISDEYVAKITEKLYKKFFADSKKKNYPVLKNLLK